MKLKIILLFQLLFGIVLSQTIIDTTNVNLDSIKKIDENLTTAQSDIEQLNKTISELDSLFNSNQIDIGYKINQLESSISTQSLNINNQINLINNAIEQVKDELVQNISSVEENVNQNLTNSNSRYEEIINTINSLSDSLLTTANNILRMKQQDSFNEAFLMARLKLGPNQKFEWNGKIYKTDYDNEMTASPIVIAIDSLKFNLDKKAKELDNAIIKANAQIIILDNYIEKVNSESNTKLQSLDATIGSRTLYWIIAIMILLILMIAVFFFLKSKVSQQQDSLSSVKDTQEKLENEAIQLDTKLIQLLEQKLEVAQNQPQQTKEVDHSLPLKLGEEIHRMRKRLKTMDESRGTQVLNKRLESLEEKINDMGYEFIELLGRSFDDGMELGKTQFIPDDNLKDGERIITRVIKPRITFKDKIIQHGDVVISQGD